MNVPNIPSSVLLAATVAQTPPAAHIATPTAPDPAEVERQAQENDLYTSLWSDVETRLSKAIKRTSDKDLQKASPETVAELKSKALAQVLDSIDGLNTDDVTKTNLKTRLENNFDRVLPVKMGLGVDKKGLSLDSFQGVKKGVQVTAGVGSLMGEATQLGEAALYNKTGISSPIGQAFEGARFMPKAPRPRWFTLSQDALNNTEVILRGMQGPTYNETLGEALDETGTDKKFIGSLADLGGNASYLGESPLINATVEQAGLGTASAQPNTPLEIGLRALRYGSTLWMMSKPMRTANPANFLNDIAVEQTQGEVTSDQSAGCEAGGDSEMREALGFHLQDGDWVRGEDTNGNGLIDDDENEPMTDEEYYNYLDSCENTGGSEGNSDGIEATIGYQISPSTLRSQQGALMSVSSYNFCADLGADTEGLGGLGFGIQAGACVLVPTLFSLGEYAKLSEEVKWTDDNLSTPRVADGEQSRAAGKVLGLHVSAGLSGAVLGLTSSGNPHYDRMNAQGLELAWLSVPRTAHTYDLGATAGGSGTSATFGKLGIFETLEYSQMANNASKVWLTDSTPLEKGFAIGVPVAVNIINLGATRVYAGDNEGSDSFLWAREKQIVVGSLIGGGVALIPWEEAVPFLGNILNKEIAFNGIYDPQFSFSGNQVRLGFRW